MDWYPPNRAFCNPDRADCNPLTDREACRLFAIGFLLMVWCFWTGMAWALHRERTFQKSDLPGKIPPGLAKPPARFGGLAMNLEIWTHPAWLPVLFLLGLATMGLIFAFVAGCERV